MMLAVHTRLSDRSRPTPLDGYPPPISRVNPMYTAEAMRARIQGIVELRAVVELDGSLSDVRVSRAIDPGLDQSAIDAVKQWRYAPAMKGDVPVRTVITIRVSFAIPGLPPVLAWPEGFEPPGAGAGDATWRSSVDESSGLRVHLSYPEGWTLDASGSPTSLLTLRTSDGSRRVIVARPRPASFALDAPLTAPRLQHRRHAVEPVPAGRAPAVVSSPTRRHDMDRHERSPWKTACGRCCHTSGQFVTSRHRLSGAAV